MLIPNLDYLPQHGIRGQLDLWGPDHAGDCQVAVLIHGGGFVEFSKERMAGVAEFLAGQGWSVANINYRLLTDAPYPAALLDALAAVDWVTASNHPYLAQERHQRPLLIGASAGGFLALMAGFLLRQTGVRGVVSIRGPALPGRYGVEAMHGEHDPRLFLAPTQLASVSAPPTLLVHSRNDRLVDPREAIALAETLANAGATAELYQFDGPGELHGIWREERPSPRLEEHIEDRTAAFVNHLP